MYLELAEDDLDDWVLAGKIAWGTLICRNDCRDDFITDATAELFPRSCCAVYKKNDKRKLGLIKEEFHCNEVLCLCRKTYGYNSDSDKYKFGSRGLNKRTLENTGMG